uniref:Uncharacterized protein n=1 Tax=Anguilla anguilla TaxID=7936 RepID=A0A0E9PUM4_ANGAN
MDGWMDAVRHILSYSLFFPVFFTIL